MKIVKKEVSKSKHQNGSVYRSGQGYYWLKTDKGYFSLGDGSFYGVGAPTNLEAVGAELHVTELV